MNCLNNVHYRWLHGSCWVYLYSFVYLLDRGGEFIFFKIKNQDFIYLICMIFYLFDFFIFLSKYGLYRPYYIKVVKFLLNIINNNIRNNNIINNK